VGRSKYAITLWKNEKEKAFDKEAKNFAEVFTKKNQKS
jgi:hypothetical protein|tara:strand:+ start:127 stop:240 length:114 start_codon:yes stop_codon:yes gene_type:complete